MPCPEKIRRAIDEAWFRERPLRIPYRAANSAPTVREVRLLSVILDRQITYLNCFDLDRQAERQFRRDRVEAAVVVRKNRP